MHGDGEDLVGAVPGHVGALAQDLDRAVVAVEVLVPTIPNEELELAREPQAQPVDPMRLLGELLDARTDSPRPLNHETHFRTSVRAAKGVVVKVFAACASRAFPTRTPPVRCVSTTTKPSRTASSKGSRRSSRP